MNARIQLLEYLIAALRVPLQSGDAATRRAAAEYKRNLSAELRKLKLRRDKNPAASGQGATCQSTAAEAAA